jgi:hypothetical protein
MISADRGAALAFLRIRLISRRFDALLQRHKAACAQASGNIARLIHTGRAAKRCTNPKFLIKLTMRRTGAFFTQQESAGEQVG